MKKEKGFHATEYKPGKFICKPQVNGVRKSFYGKTEEIAIQKAKERYDEQLNQEKEIVISEVNDDTSINIIEKLNKIGNILQDKQNENKDDVYITVQEASDYLRISTNQMYSIVHLPDFPRQKIGRTYRILFSDLKDYMKKHRFSQI